MRDKRPSAALTASTRKRKTGETTRKEKGAKPGEKFHAPFNSPLSVHLRKPLTPHSCPIQRHTYNKGHATRRRGRGVVFQPCGRV